MTLIGMLTAEMTGAPALLLWAGGALLLVGRGWHYWVILQQGWGNGRALSMVLTFAAMLLFAGAILLETADEPVTPTMLSDYLGISTGSATAAIDRLERAGFVRRVPNSHDRRGLIIEPVEGQQERLLSAYHQLRSRYAELIEGISDDELDVINRFLKGIERIELS